MQCKARHGDHQQNTRELGLGHIKTDEEEQDNDGKDGPEEIQMDIFDEEEDERAEEVAKKREVVFSTFGQSSNFTIKARHVLKYGPHPGSSGWKYITGEVATQSGPQ